MKNKTTYFTTCLIIIFMTTGCVMTKKAKQWEPVQQGRRSFVHIVKWPDENLARISSWYTGSELNEERLADNNPNINPKQLIIGDRVFIPNDLLIRRDSMTEDFIKQPLLKPDDIEKTESEQVAPAERQEKKEPEPATSPEKIETKPVTKPEKKKNESLKKDTEKKKAASKPEQAPEEEEELNLFGPK